MSHSTNPLAEPPKKSEGNGAGRLIVVALILVGLIWFCRAINKGDENEAATSPPATPSIAYTLLDGEDYGSAGNMGHSYRLIVPANAGINEVYAAAEYEALRHKANWESVTIFVYNGRDPREDGLWAADRFYEWARATDAFRQCNGPC